MAKPKVVKTAPKVAVKPAATKKAAPKAAPEKKAPPLSPSQKKITTALAIANEKLGAGAVAKYNAARAVGTLKFQTEKMYLLQMIQRSEDLAQAILDTPISLLTALQDAANLGLSISPQLGHVYLIPQRPKAGEPLEVYAKVSYKGMEQVVQTSGTVLSITTDLVYENDDFKRGVNMDGPFFNFEMAMGDRGALQGGFCLARYANGDKHLEWMPVDDIMGCKEAATKAQGGKTPFVWIGKFASEQYKKCVVRRAAKHWPTSQVVERLIHKFDIENPMEFGSANVIEGEHVEVLSDTHVEEIRKALPNLADDEASVWMQMAAKARKFDSIRDVPVDRFEEVKEALVTRARLVEEKRAQVATQSELEADGDHDEGAQ